MQAFTQNMPIIEVLIAFAGFCALMTALSAIANGARLARRGKMTPAMWAWHILAVIAGLTVAAYIATLVFV